MKKTTVFLCFIGSMLLIGCSKAKNEEMVSEVKIGISVYNQDDAFISSTIKRLETCAKKKEADTNCKITLNTVDGKSSQTMQNDQVDKFIKQGYDVLCVNLVDRTAAATIIDKAKAANVPIVFFNREPVAADMERWDKVCYVGSVPEEAGRMQGEIILEQYEKDKASVDRNQDGKIQYVMLEGEQGHQDTLIRTEYCLLPLTEHDISLEKLANGTANWQRSQGEEKMSGWIKQFGGSIEVVFSNNDEMALGAIAAIEKTNFKGIIVVGVDGIDLAKEAIKEGKMIGTVLNNGEKQAENIFKIAYEAGTTGDMSQIEELKESQYVRSGHIKIINH